MTLTSSSLRNSNFHTSKWILVSCVLLLLCRWLFSWMLTIPSKGTRHLLLLCSKLNINCFHVVCCCCCCCSVLKEAASKSRVLIGRMLESRIPPSNLQHLLRPGSNSNNINTNNKDKPQPDTRQAWEIEHEADRQLFDLTYVHPAAKEAIKQAIKPPSVSLAVEAAMKNEKLKQKQEEEEEQAFKKMLHLKYGHKAVSRPVPAFKPDTRPLWEIKH